MKRKKNLPGSAENLYGVSETDPINKAYDELGGESGGTGFRHSRYYHSFYRGYTEIRTEDFNGKRWVHRSQLIYTAPYKKADTSPVVYFYYLLSYAILAVLTILCYIFALADANVPGNSSRLVAIPGSLTIIPLILLVVSLVIYFFRKKEMTLYQWSGSSTRLQYSGLAVCIGEGLTALASLAAMFVYPETPWKNASLCVGILLLGAGAGLGIFCMERQMPYIDVENTVSIPEGERHEIW